MEDFLTEVEYNRLSELLDILCSSLSEEDEQCLKAFRATDLPPSVVNEIRDGRDLAVALRRTAICDETNLQPVLDVLKCLRRFDLLRIAYSHERKAVKVDPLEDFLIQESTKANHNFEDTSCATSNSAVNLPSTSSGKRSSHESIDDTDRNTMGTSRKKVKRGKSNTTSSSTSSGSASAAVDYLSPELPRNQASKGNSTEPSGTSQDNHSIRQRHTCDVRLRVWAEYCDHDRVLIENVFSNKADPLEHKLERFSHACSILNSRDLGCIVCDIKFSEITYLDAFWRDYLNGSLLEALKGVFITESLKQAVGNEPIKLLVSIDEEDYEEGRNILMNNVYLDHGRDKSSTASCS